jgi:hypothetical protein
MQQPEPKYSIGDVVEYDDGIILPGVSRIFGRMFFSSVGEWEYDITINRDGEDEDWVLRESEIKGLANA